MSQTKMDPEFARAVDALVMRMGGASFTRIATEMRYSSAEAAREAVASVTWSQALLEDGDG